MKKIYTVKVGAKKSLPQNLKAESDIAVPENNTGIHSGIVSNIPARSEKEVYSESYIIVSKLGVISADEAGMQDFEITPPEYVREGAELVYIANADKPSEDDDIVEFYDEVGGEISAVPENQRITISIWLNPDTVYNPVIAVKD